MSKEKAIAGKATEQRQDYFVYNEEAFATKQFTDDEAAIAHGKATPSVTKIKAARKSKWVYTKENAGE